MTSATETRCDFCSSPDPCWLYDCESFERRVGGGDGLIEVTVRSNGAWLACEPCAELIEHNDSRGLAHRAVGLLRARYGELVSHNHIRASVARMHHHFLAHKTGGRRPYAPLEAVDG